MQYFILDVKQLLKNRLIIAFFIMMLCVMVGDPLFVLYQFALYPDFAETIGSHPHQFWVLINSAGWGNGIYNTLFWIFPVILSGLSLYNETITQTNLMRVVRGGKTQYLLSKVGSSFLFSLLFMLMLLLINLFTTYLIFPTSADQTAQYQFYIPQTLSFSYVAYANHPLLFALLYVFLNALAIAIATAFCVGLHMTFRFPNKYVALSVPVIVCYAIGFLMNSSSYLMYYDLQIVIQPFAASLLEHPVTHLNVIVAFAMWIMLSGILIICGLIRNKDIL